MPARTGDLPRPLVRRLLHRIQLDLQLDPELALRALAHVGFDDGTREWSRDGSEPSYIFASHTSSSGPRAAFRLTRSSIRFASSMLCRWRRSLCRLKSSSDSLRACSEVSGSGNRARSCPDEPVLVELGEAKARLSQVRPLYRHLLACLVHASPAPPAAMHFPL